MSPFHEHVIVGRRDVEPTLFNGLLVFDLADPQLSMVLQEMGEQRVRVLVPVLYDGRGQIVFGRQPLDETAQRRQPTP